MSDGTAYLIFWIMPCATVVFFFGIIPTIRDKIKDYKKKQRHKRAVEQKKQELCKSSHLVYIHDISPDIIVTETPRLIDLDNPNLYLENWFTTKRGTCKKLYFGDKPSYAGCVLFDIFNDCNTIEQLKIKLDLLGYKMQHWKLELVESEVEE